MTKVIVALVWPGGIASIACAALALRRRDFVIPRLRRTGRPVLAPGGGAGSKPGRQTGSRGMAVIIIAGALAVYGVMALLGLLVVHHGPTIDRPVYSWTVSHRIHVWAGVMKRLTKIGNTWTTWGAAGAAAACLAASWRRYRWVPPVALGALVLVDHFVTLALRHTFHRLGPPDAPFGTYPSGGCDRAVVFYGLIAYLLWREHSGRRRGAILAAAATAALAFNEGYSRAYLTLHWLTDILSGWLYGGLLLLVFIVAVRRITGPAGTTLIADRGSDADEGATRDRVGAAV